MNPRTHRTLHAAFARLAAVLLPAALGAQEISIVNMIPVMMSKEKQAQSEPFLSMLRHDTQLAVGSSYTSNMKFCKKGDRKPVYATLDGGEEWFFLCLLPVGKGLWPMNTTVQLSGDGSMLLTSLMTYPEIDGVRTQLSRVLGFTKPPLRTTAARTLIEDLLGIANPGAVTSVELLSRVDTDQPYLRASPRSNSTGIVVAAGDRSSPTAPSPECTMQVFVAFTDMSLTRTPKVDCLGGTRPNVGTMPTARAVLHGDGTGYAIHYRPVGAGYDVDVVVSRRDRTKLAFDALTDDPPTVSQFTLQTDGSTNPADCTARDGQRGYRVVRCAKYPLPSDIPDGYGDFGQQRRMETELSIAVHPSMSNKLFIAWAETSPTHGTHLALHFAKSDDSGGNWTHSSFVVDHATSPALAVADDGAVGILYQELEGVGATARWKTQFALSTDDLATTPTVTTLASVRADTPLVVGDVYLGDYVQLEAVGNSFFGVFSASNDLTATGGTFLNLTNPRHYSPLGKPIDLAGHAVAFSVDPYFFKVLRP